MDSTQAVIVDDDILDGLDMVFQCFSEKVIDARQCDSVSRFNKEDTYRKITKAMEWILEVTEDRYKIQGN